MMNSFDGLRNGFEDFEVLELAFSECVVANDRKMQ